ncbi:MAG: aminopeptidase [Phycisphaerales bacterium]|jgi:aminopeptidase|nr:aminopeptidase [Phycisphaerales bacterium]
MRDPRLDRLADVLVKYSTRVNKGDLVAVRAEPGAFPLLRAIFEAVLKAGGNPVWIGESEELQESILAHASDEQLAFLSPLDMHRVETVDVQIALWAEVNTKAFSRYDPARVAAKQSARRPFLKRFLARAAEGKLRWVGTLYPTLASAQDAEMSLDQYADFVFKAGLLHLPDPAAAWAEVFQRQERVREFLQKRKSVHFHVPPHAGHDGTDLTVNVDGSTWINCGGHENFPDGEVFAGPQGVEGHVNYTFPAVYEGREVHGVRLAFKGGRVVDASATKNEEFLIKMLDQDAGARTLGEIAVGTNYMIKEFTRNTLFDEKIGGTFHAAVGAGYPESGSTNESGLHWDMVCDMRPGENRPGGVIKADGEVVQRDGRFLGEGWPAPA